MPEDSRTVTAPDGRTLAVCLWGPAGGSPLVLLHGGLGGRLFHHGGGQYERVGARVVTFDRPGFGSSTPHRGRRVADGAQDVVTVADSLGIDRFAVLGVSAGGPYALATAALFPGRVTRCATVVSGAPADADGMDALADLPAELQQHWQDLRARGEEYLVEDHARVLAAVRSWPHRDGVDAEAVLARAVEDALGAGPWGYVDDWLAEAQPWGVDVAAIRAPTRLMVAHDDDTVPPSHVRWLAARIPGAEVERVAGDHMGPRDEAEERLLAWLVRGADGG